MKTLTHISLLFILALFQSFTVQDVFAAPSHKVDKESRANHARELLGNRYKGSGAHKAEKIQDLHISIFENVRSYLPKKYKGQALSISETILREAKKHDFDPVFIMAVIKTESSFQPKVRGSAGEIGLMQIKPSTAKQIAEKFDYVWKGDKSLENPIENIKLGVAYFSHLRAHFAGYANKYLSAYNMGASKVKKLYKSEVKPKIYTQRVMKNYSDIYFSLVASRSPSLSTSDN